MNSLLTGGGGAVALGFLYLIYKIIDRFRPTQILKEKIIKESNSNDSPKKVCPVHDVMEKQIDHLETSHTDVLKVVTGLRSTVDQTGVHMEWIRENLNEFKSENKQNFLEINKSLRRLADK